MSRYERFADRIRGARALGALRTFGATRTFGAMPPLSRWAWAADGLLALALAVATIVGDLNRAYVELRPDLAGSPVRVPGQLPLPPQPTEGPPLPRPVPAVEHLLPPVELWEVAAAALTALPLVLRRRFPLTVYWVVTVAAVLLHLGDTADDATTVTFASGLVAAYSAAMYSPHRKAVAGSLLAGVLLYAVFPLVPDVESDLVPVLVLLPVALASHGVHLWRERERALRAEREEDLRGAVEAERARIARELHDVVTHNVSMMTIQAGAARTVLATSPDLAREAMLAVEAAGRTALSELRHVMGLLTMAADGPDPATDVDLAPQPGLDRLTELTDRVRSSGVPVALEVRGTPVPLPSGMDLAAYRVVQEALTNVVKHAAGARVSVTVAYAADRLEVEVSDTGGRPRRSPEPTPGGGHGLLGLRERLAVYGGTLRAERRPHGGYLVRAEIPWEAP
ncbi:sensor histidine kinase [Streptomyces sp. NPDC059534]|uniref:sensor histidine kinase n=1 Tax=Streptomyces sp. NPDC059534 TaxID=3346859 RepID=UPI00368AC037